MDHELIEKVRERAYADVPDDDAPLDFYGAALALGCSDDEAEALDERLTARTMAARGAI